MITSKTHPTLRFPLQHRTLEVLDIQHFDFELPLFCIMLGNLPLLKRLWARWISIEPQSLEPHEGLVLTHSSLEKLSVGGEIPIDLFRAVACPSSTCLQFGGALDEDMELESEAEGAIILADFLQRGSTSRSLELAMRRGVSSNFVRVLLEEVRTMPMLHTLIVPSFHHLFDEEQVPLTVPNSVRTLALQQEISNQGFMEWMVRLQLDDREPPLELIQGDTGGYWLEFSGDTDA